MARSPTYSETRTSLCHICEIAQRGLYLLGRCREAGDGEELTHLVLEVSKEVLEVLPCLQLEHDAIEEADSMYGHILNVLDNAEEAGGCCPPVD